MRPQRWRSHALLGWLPQQRGRVMEARPEHSQGWTSWQYRARAPVWRGSRHYGNDGAELGRQAQAPRRAPCAAAPSMEVTRAPRVNATARVLVSWGHSARCGPLSWRPPLKPNTIAVCCLASRHTGARALYCRVAPHWRCSSRSSSARPCYCGSHASSACDLHRWDHSARSGFRAWRPHPELSTIALYGLALRRRRTRSTSPCCPTLAVLQLCLQRTPVLLWQSREERVCPPSIGPQRMERVWGLVPTSQARHRRLMVPSIAPYRCVRSILLCRPTLAVLQPCLQRTPALLWHSREERA